LIQHDLVLLILHLYLRLVEAKLLKKFQLLLLTKVLVEKQLSLLSKELHLSNLVQFLHLMQLLELEKRLNLWISPFRVLTLHVTVAATAAEVLVVTIIKHVDTEAHRVHIRVHEVFANTH
jgi:hypothetical protein